MTLFVISIPLMVLAVAIAVVPLIVAMTIEQKERIRVEGCHGTATRMAPFYETAVRGTGPINSGDPVVAGRPGARLADEYPV